jgi:hypothetical protein
VSVEAEAERRVSILPWKSKVDSVKRNDEIFGVVDLLESVNDSGFSTDSPSEILVCHSVLKAHALLVDCWKIVFMHCRQVVPVEAKVAVIVN